MKLLFTLFGLVFCLVHVNGRNVHDYNADDETNEEESLTQIRDPTANQMRHRRRSRQSFNDYYYHDYRRDNNRQQDEMYSQILRLLEEISINLRRPPTPTLPQPIYIPYPVPYPVPQYMSCKNNAPPKSNTTEPSVPDLTDRLAELDKLKQICEMMAADTNSEDDEDGARPISFVPVPPKAMNVNPPPVEHGSSQAGMETSTATPAKTLGTCKASILKCCNFSNKQDQQTCFNKDGCNKTFKTGVACSPQVIKRVIDEFSAAYAPTPEV